MISLQQPLVSCVMPTYGRPDYVPESLQMFLDQDYPNKELIILNDCCGQTYNYESDQVRVYNYSDRFASLGEKRNAAIELAKGEVIAIWDDDDVSLPWRLSYSIEEMRRHDTHFYRPSEFLAYWGASQLHDNYSTPDWVSHGLVLFTKEIWQQVGGYSPIGLGEDRDFFKKIHSAIREDFVTFPIAKPDRYYIVRAVSNYEHMSIPGGKNPLDTTGGSIEIEPHGIADQILRHSAKSVIESRGIHSPNIVKAGEGTAETPMISVCVALKNRSRVEDGGRILDLFPRAVRSLSDAANTVGKIELIVADFCSTDWPVSDWLCSSQNLDVKIVSVEGDFSRGRGINEAVKVSESESIFVMDADVLCSAKSIRSGIECIQSGKVGFPICKYLNRDGSPEFFQEHGKGLVFVTKKVFQNCGGIPEFKSWGGEDDIFFDRVKQFAKVERYYDEEIRHQWHPNWCRNVNYSSPMKTDYNKSFAQSCPTDKHQLLAKFEGKHQNWTGNSNTIEFYHSSRFRRVGIESGYYSWKPHCQIMLNWDKWAPEVLKWDDQTGSYSTDDGKFSLVRIEPREDLIHAYNSEYDSLKNHLKKLAPFQLLYCGGNRGDLIILEGTKQFLKRHYLEFTTIREVENVNGSIPVVVCGSGGFCRFWDTAPRMVLKLIERCPNVVVLPSSYEKKSIEKLSQCKNIYFYAREIQSLAELGENVDSAFCPDLAFFFAVPAFKQSNLKVLHAFRSDKEGFGFGNTLNFNSDISIESPHTADDFVRDISNYSKILTDRAHVAIIGLMLGCDVRLFPNRYHKNRSLFESYLQKLGCRWGECPESYIDPY